MARILVAEDDENVRTFVVRALEFSGHEIVDASDGGLALEILDADTEGFDLLLSDIKMPVMDGIELAHNVGQRFRTLPIVLMTGFADQRERAQSLEAYVYDVISKPFSLAQLVEKVEDALLGKPVEIVSLARMAV